MTLSGLTGSGLSGKIRSPNQINSPALPDVRPAPQAGCFVSGLYVSKDSAQITLRHRAFRTVAVESSSTSVKHVGETATSSAALERVFGGLMVSSNRGSLCKALLSGRTCAGFRVVFAVGTGPLHDGSSRG